MKILRIAALTITLFIYSTHLHAQKRNLHHNSAYKWFSFNWYSATISGRQFDKLAIMLPAKINDLKGNFITQFDLGSDATTIYGNSIQNYYSSRDELYRLLDTVHKATSDAGVVNYPAKQMFIDIGGHRINDLLFSENYGDIIPKDSLYTATAKYGGTIGSNFTKDKVLIIDFPKRKMCLLDTIDKYWESKAEFVNCKVKRNRIQLPLTINGKVNWIMFDTGASIFPLSIDKELWTSIVDPKEKPDTLKANSWGEKVSFYGATITSDVYLGKYKLQKAKAWYNENKRLLTFNKEENIAGTTGNSYFFNNVVVVDFKNKRFGLVK